MNESDAIALLRPAVALTPHAHWADLGAGTGTFTRALAALLGPDAHIYAVDTDDRALRSLRAWADRAPGPPRIRIIHGDFTRRLPLPPLDGIVMANALHFVRDQPAMAALATSYLRPAGRLVVIEYENRPVSRWVPHPVSSARFAELAADAGLTPPRVVAKRPSAFGGDMYVAMAVRPGESPVAAGSRTRHWHDPGSVARLCAGNQLRGEQMKLRIGWAVAAAVAVALPEASSAQAPVARDTGLIVGSVEAAIRQPARRMQNFGLIVDLSDRRLYVMSGEDVVRTFPVAIGEEGYATPSGSFTIRRMIWNPDWRPPPSAWARDKKYEAPGSPGNPMGRVKMFFREPDYYIHGTGLASSLGNARSHGCIRMRNIDAVELARLVMINGGDNRDQAWYEETIANATEMRTVTLPRPVTIRVRA